MHQMRRCCLRLRLSSQNQGAKRNSTNSKSVQVCSWSTALKTTGWNLTNQPIEKENHLPSTSILGFKMLIINLPGCISRFQKCFSWHLQPCLIFWSRYQAFEETKHPMESPSDSTSLKTQSPPTFNFSPLQTHQHYQQSTQPNHPHPHPHLAPPPDDPSQPWPSAFPSL